MYEAARVTDPIEHTSALTGFLVGAVLGIALIATVAFVTFSCGFGAALLAGMAAGIGAQGLLSLGEAIGRMSSAPSGNIVTGSSDVYVNGKPAAYATLSGVACSKHNPFRSSHRARRTSSSMGGRGPQGRQDHVRSDDRRRLARYFFPRRHTDVSPCRRRSAAVASDRNGLGVCARGPGRRIGRTAEAGRRPVARGAAVRGEVHWRVCAR